MLDLLFKGADITLNYWRKVLNKKKQFKLGFIQVLHTFGKSMNRNPHIHILVAEVAIGNITIEKKLNIYNLLKKYYYNLKRKYYYKIQILPN